MSLYLKQNESRSQLQEKLAKELQERAKNKPQDGVIPDGVEDSRYMEGTKQTTTLAWVWLIIGLALGVIVIWLIVIAS